MNPNNGAGFHGFAARFGRGCHKTPQARLWQKSIATARVLARCHNATEIFAQSHSEILPVYLYKTHKHPICSLNTKKIKI
jgi:hypothetical protein